MKTAAIILAAGRGSRMKELTAEKPKCLLTLAGKTLLEWQAEALRAAGIRDILIVKGYKGAMIKGDFESAENPRWDQTNMLSTLLCAGSYISRQFENSADRILVAYADIVYHPDHVQKLLEAKADIAISYDTEWHELWKLRFDDVLSDAETFRQENGFLQEIGGKAGSISEIQGQYMGLISFNAQGWEIILNVCAELGPKTDSTDMTSFLRLLLTRSIPIGAVAVRGKWCEADNAEDLARYNSALMNDNWTHDWRERG